MKPASPPGEERRLEILRLYDVLHTPPETAFDQLTGLAAQICGTPLALVDENRVWFKSKTGVTVSEIPRNTWLLHVDTFKSSLRVVPDTALDNHLDVEKPINPETFVSEIERFLTANHEDRKHEQNSDRR